MRVRSAVQPSVHGDLWKLLILQVVLCVLGGMVLDGGLLGTLLFAGSLLGWILTGLVALVRRRRPRPAVAAAAWLVATLVVGALGFASGAGCIDRKIARRSLVGSHMRQLVLGCIAYSSEDPAHAWPADLASVVAWSQGDLDPKLLRIAWAPQLERPFCYVRPVADAKGDQPVLLADPASDAHGVCVVAYADGHLETLRGAAATATWVAALRLADLPSTRADGVGPAGWRPPAP